MNRFVWLVALLSICSDLSFADGWEIAVITRSGAVWARELTPTSVGAGVRLRGPSLFGGPDRRAVLGRMQSIDVLTTSGDLWTHFADQREIEAGRKLSGAPISTGSSPTKYVFYNEPCSTVYAVGSDGTLWSSAVIGTQLEPSEPMRGARLFTPGRDRFVLFDGFTTFYVLDLNGGVTRHDLFNDMPEAPCPNTVFDATPIIGPALFGGPLSAKYVLMRPEGFLVVDDFGTVLSYNLFIDRLDPAVQLTGPALFSGLHLPGQDDDVDVVLYLASGTGKKIPVPNNGQ